MNFRHLQTAKDAENAFAEQLEKKGHEIIGRNSPVDITSKFRGQKYSYEIKSTILNAKSNFFGAVTLNQLKSALKNQKNYRFVIARKINNQWQFKIYNLKQFLSFCGNGSFRIAFNIPQGQRPKTNKKMSLIRLKRLISFHQKFRK